MTTTVYHFGISEGGGDVVAYAYRSTNDFISEKVPVGIGVKPACTIPDYDLGCLLAQVEAMMNEQRRLEELQPPSQRLHIGGEAHAIHLTKMGCTCGCLFRFADFEAQASQIFRPRL